MLLRLARLSTGLAAAAVGLMVFGPAELHRLGADLALALAAAAFLLWRLSVALERRLAKPSDPALPPLQLGLVALVEAHAAVARLVAAAPSFEAALLDAGAALRGELGARQLRVYRVNAGERPLSVSELMAERPGFRAPARALPGGSVMARAITEARSCLDLPRAVALPVLRSGLVVALLELMDIELAVDEKALTELMMAAGASLAARADEPLPAQASRHDALAGVVPTGPRATLIVRTGPC